MGWIFLGFHLLPVPSLLIQIPRSSFSPCISAPSWLGAPWHAHLDSTPCLPPWTAAEWMSRALGPLTNVIMAEKPVAAKQSGWLDCAADPFWKFANLMTMNPCQAAAASSLLQALTPGYPTLLLYSSWIVPCLKQNKIKSKKRHVIDKGSHTLSSTCPLPFPSQLGSFFPPLWGISAHCICWLITICAPKCFSS